MLSTNRKLIIVVDIWFANGIEYALMDEGRIAPIPIRNVHTHLISYRSIRLCQSSVELIFLITSRMRVKLKKQY